MSVYNPTSEPNRSFLQELGSLGIGVLRAKALEEFDLEYEEDYQVVRPVPVSRNNQDGELRLVGTANRDAASQRAAEQSTMQNRQSSNMNTLMLSGFLVAGLLVGLLVAR